jgi:dCMP deaminase
MRQQIFTDIIKILAQQSTCDRANVGALLLKNGRIIATGYNGSLPGQPHCNDVGHLLIENHCVRSVHAEMNIISFCAKEGIHMLGCELFVTHMPCQICTKMLIQCGVKKIYYLYNYKADENPFIKLIETEQINSQQTA